MQKCSICEKPIYGHRSPTSTSKRVNGATVVTEGKVVCGSCPLNKSDGGATGKSFSQVRMEMAKLVTKEIPESREGDMAEIKVRSNVPNRTILLDGKHPVVFGKDGIGRLKEAHKALFDREMVMKPGRFSYVVEEVVAVEAPEPVEEKEEVITLDLPPEVTQEETPVEEPKKPVKASRKK